VSRDRKPAIDPALRAMRKEYAAALPALVAALAALVEEAAARPEALPEARRAAHRLRGTAGSYGFAALGEAAGRIEDAIDDGAPDPELRALLPPLAALTPQSRKSSGSSK
jgi:HPt (histidine-containing phosphotransfer) domain-containing protein